MSLIQSLNQYLVQNSNSWSINNFYCSGLYDCSRKMYYDRLNIPQETTTDPVNKRRLNKGTYIHEMFQKYFEDMGILVSKEEYVKDTTIQVAGKMDCIVTLEGTDYVVEIKTSDSKDKIDTMPYLSHLWQLQIYMHIKGIKKGKLFYVFLDKSTDKIVTTNKDFSCYTDKDLLEIDVEYNPDIVRIIQTKLEKIIQCINLKQPPERESDKCTYCPYKGYCNTHVANDIDLASIFENFLYTP